MRIAAHLVGNQQALHVGVAAAHVNVAHLEAKGSTGWIAFELEVEPPAATVIRPARAPSVPILTGTGRRRSQDIADSFSSYRESDKSAQAKAGNASRRVMWFLRHSQALAHGRNTLVMMTFYPPPLHHWSWLRSSTVLREFTAEFSVPFSGLVHGVGISVRVEAQPNALVPAVGAARYRLVGHGAFGVHGARADRHDNLGCC